MKREKPVWLEFSGLPERINTKVRQGAWSVFVKLIELDCERNRQPGIVEIPLGELAERVGLRVEVVQKALEGLREKKYAEAYVPEHPDEEALFQAVRPLRGVLTRPDIERRMQDAGIPGPYDFRYLEPAPETPAGRELDAALEGIVDEYYRTVQVTMNTFTLDELRLFATRYSLDMVRRAFDWARRREIRSLRVIARELRRWENKDRHDPKRETKPATSPDQIPEVAVVAPDAHAPRDPFELETDPSELEARQAWERPPENPL